MSKNVSHPLLPIEQLRYASWLSWSMRAGLVVLATTFFLYVSGLIEPLVQLEHHPGLWNLSAARFQEATGSPTGWGWLALIGKSDYAGLLGIAILAGCSLLCLLAIMPIYARRKDRVYLAICALQVGVLLLAASGILTAGH